jgi:hypothetical protein
MGYEEKRIRIETRFLYDCGNLERIEHDIIEALKKEGLDNIKFLWCKD